MGWLLCFLLIVIAIIGSQFPPADRDPGHLASKTRSMTRSPPSTHLSADPAGQSEPTSAQPPSR